MPPNLFANLLPYQNVYEMDRCALVSSNLQESLFRYHVNFDLVFVRNTVVILEHNYGVFVERVNILVNLLVGFVFQIADVHFAWEGRWRYNIEE